MQFPFSFPKVHFHSGGKNANCNPRKNIPNEY